MVNPWLFGHQVFGKKKWEFRVLKICIFSRAKDHWVELERAGNIKSFEKSTQPVRIVTEPLVRGKKGMNTKKTSIVFYLSSFVWESAAEATGNLSFVLNGQFRTVFIFRNLSSQEIDNPVLITAELSIRIFYFYKYL